jgi:hypothetical protein
MTVDQMPRWADEVARFIESRNLADTAPVADLVEMVLGGALYWETPLADGQRLMLVRLSNPVTMREEVLLGNILFNDFMNKSVAYAIDEAGLGEVLPITNDLENAYYLILTPSDLVTIRQAIQNYIMAHLPDLFFGDEDAERGIHGKLETMFSFIRSDYEPFPVFAIPTALSKQMETRVRQVLFHLLETQPLISLRTRGKTTTQHPSFALRTIQAGMAFFYGQDGKETQSQPELMARAVTRYGILTPEELVQALQFRSLQDGLGKDKSITNASKPLVKTLSKQGHVQSVIEASYESILGALVTEETQLSQLEVEIDDDSRQLVIHEVLKKLVKRAIGSASVQATFDEERLRLLLSKMLQHFAKSIEEKGSKSEWFLGSIISKGKLLPMDMASYLSSVLAHTTFGPHMLSVPSPDDKTETAVIVCRVCGRRSAIVDEKDVLLGRSGQFHNQKPNLADKDIRRVCEVCALHSYLGARQIGYRSDPNKGMTIPSRSNLIFHYGHHSAMEAKRIGEQINVIRDMLRQVRNARIAVLQANKKIKQEEKKQRFGPAEEEDVAMAALNEKLEKGTITTEEMERLKALWKSMADRVAQAQEVVESVRSAHVVDIGIGEQRLIVFALENLYDERDLAQKRFARNRVAVFTLLALLQDVCGCDGPYYFQTLPRIDVEHSAPGVFYIGHHEIEAAKYRRQYEALSLFAHRVIPGYGLGAFKKRLKLAEDLAERPLETFSAVLRDSPRRPREESKYRRFVGGRDKVRFDRNLGVFDSWAYLEVLHVLRELEEVIEEQS